MNGIIKITHIIKIQNPITSLISLKFPFLTRDSSPLLRVFFVCI